MNHILIAVAAALLWSALMFGAGWAWRGDRAGAADARQQAGASAAAVQQVNDTRATEHAQAAAVAAIGDAHEQDRETAEAVPAAVAAELRAGNLRLRDEWAGCRDDLAGAVVRAGRDADDQLRTCQAVILADRKVH